MQGAVKKLSGHVVVVGGGYVALDGAQAAMRQGAESVTIVYRRTIDAFRADAEDIAKARKQGIKFAFTWAPVKVEAKTGNWRCLAVMIWNCCRRSVWTTLT